MPRVTRGLAADASLVSWPAGLAVVPLVRGYLELRGLGAVPLGLGDAELLDQCAESETRRASRNEHRNGGNARAGQWHSQARSRNERSKPALWATSTSTRSSFSNASNHFYQIKPIQVR